MAYRWQGGRRSCKNPSRTPQVARPYAIGNATSPSPEAKAKMTWGTQNGLFGEAKLLKDQQDSGFDVKVTPPSCVHLLSQPASNAGVGGTTNRPCRAQFLSYFSTQDIRNTQRKLLSTYKEGADRCHWVDHRYIMATKSTHCASLSEIPHQAN